MISDAKAAIVNKLKELYPTGYVIYDEVLPETISTPAFLIRIASQSYNKRFNNKYTNELSFDVAYYSNLTTARVDCVSIQENLLHAFDLISTYKVRNKNAKITDNVLHFTFDIRYSEFIAEELILMQQQQINTNL